MATVTAYKVVADDYTSAFTPHKRTYTVGTEVTATPGLFALSTFTGAITKLTLAEPLNGPLRIVEIEYDDVDDLLAVFDGDRLACATVMLARCDVIADVTP